MESHSVGDVISPGSISSPVFSYVYGLSASSGGGIRYVGCSVCPRSRLAAHVSEGQFPISIKSAKAAWIADLLSEGSHPLMTILEKCRFVESNHRERYWIEKLISDGMKILNAAIPPAKKKVVRNKPRNVVYGENNSVSCDCCGDYAKSSEFAIMLGWEYHENCRAYVCNACYDIWPEISRLNEDIYLLEERLQ